MCRQRGFEKIEASRVPAFIKENRIKTNFLFNLFIFISFSTLLASKRSKDREEGRGKTANKNKSKATEKLNLNTICANITCRTMVERFHMSEMNSWKECGVCSLYNKKKDKRTWTFNAWKTLKKKQKNYYPKNDFKYFKFSFKIHVGR